MDAIKPPGAGQLLTYYTTNTFNCLSLETLLMKPPVSSYNLSLSQVGSLPTYRNSTQLQGAELTAIEDRKGHPSYSPAISDGEIFPRVNHTSYLPFSGALNPSHHVPICYIMWGWEELIPGEQFSPYPVHESLKQSEVSASWGPHTTPGRSSAQNGQDLVSNF